MTKKKDKLKIWKFNVSNNGLLGSHPHRLDQRENKTGKVDESLQLYNAKLICKQEENIYDLYYAMKRQNLWPMEIEKGAF